MLTRGNKKCCLYMGRRCMSGTHRFASASTPLYGPSQEMDAKAPPVPLDAIATTRRGSQASWRGLSDSPRWCRFRDDFTATGSNDAADIRAARQMGVYAWEADPSWPRYSNAAYPSMQCEIFCQVPSMSSWCIDRGLGYCRLCDEPVGNLATHTGYWDHCNLLLFLRVCSAFQRRWSCSAVNSSAFAHAVSRRYGGRLDGTDAVARDHDTAIRRQTLREVIEQLCAEPHPACPVRGTLRYALQGKWGLSMGGMGERMFRATVGELIVPLLPPMSAQMQTRFQQKCWGRKNLEMMYDELRLGALESHFGQRPRVEKNEKGSLMRQLAAELILARSLGAITGVPSAVNCDLVAAHDVSCDPTLSPPPHTAVSVNETAEDLREVLVSWLLHRLAFELVFNMTAHYVSRATTVWERHGRPALHELHRLGFARLDDEDDTWM